MSELESLRHRIRSQFPPLACSDSICFLDNAAGTLVPASVISSVTEVLTCRGVVNSLPGYKWGRQQEKIKSDAHDATGLFVNAPRGGKDIVLGPSATALAFRLSAALGKQFVRGDAIVVSGLEHECNASPWRHLQATLGLELRVWRARWPSGELDVEDLKALLEDGKVRLVALTVASNCFGLCNDVALAASVCHAQGALICVDSVHGAPHFLPNVQRDDLDFLLFSPYKLCAPHLGALYIRGSLLRDLDVPTLHFYDPSEAHKFEYGTPPYESLAGWLSALEYFACCLGGKGPSEPLTRAALEAAWIRVADLERPVKAALVQGLSSIPGVTVYGSLDLERRVGTVAFRVLGLSCKSVAEKLGERGVCVGNGHFYATMPNEALGLLEDGGVVRASIAHYTSVKEVERFLSEVRSLAERQEC